jgi:NAD(P)-dependent dehydrogenase (short-subunit alcohol dehydrogenase family)
MRSVVVTGTSTGIGEACAQRLVKEGVRVFGSVRRAEDGARLVRALGALFVPLVFDVTDQTAVNAAAARVADALGNNTLFGLVNNAGIAVVGPLLELQLEDFRKQLDVNVIGQVCVTQAFAPLLGADRSRVGAPGRILMMSSVGGRHGSPFLAPYNSSKFALEGLSECLRRELMLFGIDVIIIAPGMIATPIWDKVEAMDSSPFAGSAFASAMEIAKGAIAKGRQGLPAARIAETVWIALTARRPKTRYTVTPTPVQLWMTRVVPRRMIDRIIAKRLGLSPGRLTGTARTPRA